MVMGYLIILFSNIQHCLLCCYVKYVFVLLVVLLCGGVGLALPDSQKFMWLLIILFAEMLGLTLTIDFTELWGN